MPLKDREAYLEYQKQYHLEKRRAKGIQPRKPAREPKQVPCGCGCGTIIEDWDKKHRRERKYARGHGNKKNKSGRIKKDDPRFKPKRPPIRKECGCGCGMYFESVWNYHTNEYTKYIQGHQLKVKELHPAFGKTPWNYEGKTSEAELIRKSPEYKEWRLAVFKRDNFTCQRCGQFGGYLEAHHIKEFALYPELRLDLDNGETLCKKCHYNHHYGGKEE